MSKHEPPRARWAVVLYVASALLAIGGVLQGVTRTYADEVTPAALGAAFQLSHIVEGFVPALVFGVLGGVVQYLADIRWALIQRLDGPNA